MQIELSTITLKELLFVLVKNLKKIEGIKFGELIFIELKENQLTMRTTNFETGVEVNINVKNSGNWSCSVNGYIFDSVVASLTGTTTTISYENNILIISSDNNISSIQITNIDDDFPPIPKIDGTLNEINTNILVDGLKSVIHATSKNITKIEFTGIYCFYEDSNFVFVATDAMRLAEKKFNSIGTNSINFIIPAKQAQTTIKIFDNINDEKIKIIQGDNGILIISKQITFYTKIINGNFPDYKKLIPEKFDSKIIISKFNLFNFIKKARFFSNKMNSIEIKIDNGNLFMKARNESIGETEEQINTLSITGLDIIVPCNYLLINDAVLQVDSDDVEIQISKNSNVPIKISGVDFDNKIDNYTALVMPLYK